MATIALAGDVMLGRGVNEALRDMRPEEPWGDVLPLLLDADLRIINLECAITDHRQPWTRTPKVFHFRADPSAVEVLRAARIAAAVRATLGRSAASCARARLIQNSATRRMVKRRNAPDLWIGTDKTTGAEFAPKRGAKTTEYTEHTETENRLKITPFTNLVRGSFASGLSPSVYSVFSVVLAARSRLIEREQAMQRTMPDRFLNGALAAGLFGAPPRRATGPRHHSLWGG